MIEGLNISALPSMPFEQRAKLPNCSAVYFVISDSREVLYVGRSESLVMRWRQHHLKGKLLPLSGLVIAWFEYDSVATGKSLERQAIIKLRPPLNTLLASTGKTKQRALIMFRVRQDVPRDVRLARRLHLAAKMTGISMSQIAREATEEKLDQLARHYPELAA